MIGKYPKKYKKIISTKLLIPIKISSLFSYPQFFEIPFPHILPLPKLKKKQSLEFNNNKKALPKKNKKKMGNKESQRQHSPKQQQIQKINHSRFQTIKFITSRDQDQQIIYIQSKITVPNKQQYTKWSQQLKNISTSSQDLFLPVKNQFKNQGFCGSSGSATLTFENFPYVLSDEIRNRASLQRKFFDQSELWYLIYTLISVGHEFHKSGSKVGDVRPQNVFINESGQVKVATQLTWPSQNVNYHKTFYEKEPTYLAPEELKDIQYAKTEPSSNGPLAQSFSIGLTCLDAGILNSSSTLYLKNNKFNYNELTERLHTLRNAEYSNALSLAVSSLCQPDSDQRSTCTELFKWLEPYEQTITNLQKFEPTSLPQKLSLYDQVNQANQTNQTNQTITNHQNSTMAQSFPNLYNSIPSSYGAAQPTGQNVTYNQPIPVQSQPYENPVQYQPPPPPHQFPPQNVIHNIPYQPPAQNYSHYVPNPQSVSGLSDNLQLKTVISTYTTYQFPQPQPQPYPSSQLPTKSPQYPTQNSQIPQNPQQSFSPTITQSDRDKQKTQIQKTLQKIDQQLQISRRMFP